MISRRQIERMACAESYRRLAERILANGRCHSRAARERLCGPDAAAPAALGLALQRLAELTYGQEPLGDALARRLRGMQQSDGLFGETAVPSVAGSAAAMKGLMVWGDREAELGRAADAETAEALRRGLRAICAEIDAPLSRVDEQDLAVILWQLGDRAAFREAAPVDRLVQRIGNALASHSDEDDEDDLSRYAHATAA